MSDYGMKVSKAGFDVLSTDDDNLIFSSKFGTFRVFASGSGSVTMPNPRAVQTETINHSLGYRPAFVVYSELYDVGVAGPTTGVFFMLPSVEPRGGDASIMPYVDSSDLKIRFGADYGPSGTTLNYKYFIYYNQAR